MIVAAAHPLAFALHPGAWIAVLAVAAVYAAVICTPQHAVTRRQAWCFLGSLGILLVALTWPVADLAAHWLLLALVVQRLLLLLAFPPLCIAGVPRSLVSRVTRPAALDAVARTVSRSIPAVVIVTAIAVGTLVEPAVTAQASSAMVRGAFDLLLLVAGLVLWAPVLRPVPGTERMSALGQAGYLVVQSILPSFLCVVWIFARRPLYPVYVHQHAVLGLSSLTDQQLSGFAAKLVTIFVLWAVAFAVVVRAERLEELGSDPDPLTWADVERELARVARRERRERRDAVAPAPPNRHAGRRRRAPRPLAPGSTPEDGPDPVGGPDRP